MRGRNVQPFSQEQDLLQDFLNFSNEEEEHYDYGPAFVARLEVLERGGDYEDALPVVQQASIPTCTNLAIKCPTAWDSFTAI